jgi:hypothetical protein
VPLLDLDLEIDFDLTVLLSVFGGFALDGFACDGFAFGSNRVLRWRSSISNSAIGIGVTANVKL